MVLVKMKTTKQNKKITHIFEMYLQLVFLLVFDPVSDLLFLKKLCL